MFIQLQWPYFKEYNSLKKKDKLMLLYTLLNE